MSMQICLYSLNNFIKVDFFRGVQSAARLIDWGLESLPKFIVSYFKHELFVLQCGTTLNLSLISLKHFNLKTELGIDFTVLISFSIGQWECIAKNLCKYSSWVISSIADSLKVSSFVKKYNIYVLSSKTRQLMILSGIDGLKIKSIEKVICEKY